MAKNLELEAALRKLVDNQSAKEVHKVVKEAMEHKTAEKDSTKK